MTYRALMFAAAVLCAAPAVAQNTWDGNGDLNVNINGRNNALTPTVIVTPSGTQDTNLTKVDGVTLGAPSAYGTSPGAVTVPAVNAFVTNPISVAPLSINYAAPTAGTVSATATVVATPGGKTTTVVNATAANGGTLWLNPNGTSAVSGQGIPVAPGNGSANFGTPLANAITGTCSTGTCSYTVTLGN